MENKQEKCPHLEKCKQQITLDDSMICEERIDNEWSFDDCFKYNDLESNAKYNEEGPTKTPKEWLKLVGCKER